MSTGRVVFSLDFELGWGHRQTRPSYVEELRHEKCQIRPRIEELIHLFERYEIPATWAVVGNLVESGSDELFHAPDLFEYLLDSDVDHDIGLHSFAHEPYDQLSPSEVREDLKEGREALKEWGKSPRSFVFPQNRIAHLNLLGEEDFRCYRREQPPMRSSLPGSLFAPVTFDSLPSTEAPVTVPSSWFLAARRPRKYREWYALRGLSRAIDEGQLVHYWLHPHNVVTDRSLIEEIETLFERSRSLENRGVIQIQTMSEFACESSNR